MNQTGDKKAGPIISPLKIKRISAQQINFNSSYNQSQWKLRSNNEARHKTPRNELKVDRSFQAPHQQQVISKTPRNVKEKLTNHFLEAFDFGEGNLDKSIPKHVRRLEEVLRADVEEKP